VEIIRITYIIPPSEKVRRCGIPTHRFLIVHDDEQHAARLVLVVKIAAENSGERFQYVLQHIQPFMYSPTRQTL